MKKIKKLTTKELKKVLRARLEIDVKKKRITRQWAENYFNNYEKA